MSEIPLEWVAREVNSIAVANALRDALNNRHALESQGVHCPREAMDKAEAAVAKAHAAYEKFWGRK